MSGKTKTIDLVQVLAKDATQPGQYDYRIAKLVNSVEYQCGSFLKKTEVEMLCKSKDWKVNIT